MTTGNVQIDLSSAYCMTIDGKRATSQRGVSPVFNPATKAVIAQVPDATREQLDQAVAGARRAFNVWPCAH